MGDWAGQLGESGELSWHFARINAFFSRMDKVEALIILAVILS
jgi:hypothetical protein